MTAMCNSLLSTPRFLKTDSRLEKLWPLFRKATKYYLQQLQRGEAAEHARRQLGDFVAVQHSGGRTH